MPTELSYFCTALQCLCFNKIPLVSCWLVQIVLLPGHELVINRWMGLLPPGASSNERERTSWKCFLEDGVAGGRCKGHCFAK